MSSASIYGIYSNDMQIAWSFSHVYDRKGTSNFQYYLKTDKEKLCLPAHSTHSLQLSTSSIHFITKTHNLYIVSWCKCNPIQVVRIKEMPINKMVLMPPLGIAKAKKAMLSARIYFSHYCQVIKYAIKMEKASTPSQIININTISSTWTRSIVANIIWLSSNFYLFSSWLWMIMDLINTCLRSIIQSSVIGFRVFSVY